MKSKTKKAKLPGPGGIARVEAFLSTDNELKNYLGKRSVTIVQKSDGGFETSRTFTEGATAVAQALIKLKLEPLIASKKAIFDLARKTLEDFTPLTPSTADPKGMDTTLAEFDKKVTFNRAYRVEMLLANDDQFKWAVENKAIRLEKIIKSNDTDDPAGDVEIRRRRFSKEVIRIVKALIKLRLEPFTASKKTILKVAYNVLNKPRSSSGPSS